MHTRQGRRTRRYDAAQYYSITKPIRQNNISIILLYLLLRNIQITPTEKRNESAFGHHPLATNGYVGSMVVGLGRIDPIHMQCEFQGRMAECV